MVKESNIFIGLKKTCSGVLDRGDRAKDNETGLKEGGGIKMSTTVLPLRDARSLRFEYLRGKASFRQGPLHQHVEKGVNNQ